MVVSQAGLDLIKDFESFVPFWYDDRAPAKGVKYGYRPWDGGEVKGELTIGYGHTKAAKHPLKPSVGYTITKEEAEEILDVDLDECEQDVNRLVKVPLTQSQFDALVSFQFNTGGLGRSTLLKVLNRKQYDLVPSELMKWIYDNGTVLRGLVNRRKAEVALWNGERAPKNSRQQGLLGATVAAKQVTEPLGSSGTVKIATSGAVVSGGAVVADAGEIVDKLNEVNGYVSMGTWIGFGVGALALLGFLALLYKRWADAGRPNLSEVL